MTVVDPFNCTVRWGFTVIAYCLWKSILSFYKKQYKIQKRELSCGCIFGLCIGAHQFRQGSVMGITKATIFRISGKISADELMQQTGKGLWNVRKYIRQALRSCSDLPRNILFFGFLIIISSWDDGKTHQGLCSIFLSAYFNAFSLFIFA